MYRRALALGWNTDKPGLPVAIHDLLFDPACRAGLIALLLLLFDPCGARCCLDRCFRRLHARQKTRVDSGQSLFDGLTLGPYRAFRELIDAASLIDRDKLALLQDRRIAQSLLRSLRGRNLRLAFPLLKLFLLRPVKLGVLAALAGIIGADTRKRDLLGGKPGDEVSGVLGLLPRRPHSTDGCLTLRGGVFGLIFCGDRRRLQSILRPALAHVRG